MSNVLILEEPIVKMICVLIGDVPLPVPIVLAKVVNNEVPRFYKLNSLTDEDIEFIRGAMRIVNKLLPEVLTHLLPEMYIVGNSELVRRWRDYIYKTHRENAGAFITYHLITSLGNIPTMRELVASSGNRTIRIVRPIMLRENIVTVEDLEAPENAIVRVYGGKGSMGWLTDEEISVLDIKNPVKGKEPQVKISISSSVLRPVNPQIAIEGEEGNKLEIALHMGSRSPIFLGSLDSLLALIPIDTGEKTRFGLYTPLVPSDKAWIDMLNLLDRVFSICRKYGINLEKNLMMLASEELENDTALKIKLREVESILSRLPLHRRDLTGILIPLTQNTKHVKEVSSEVWNIPDMLNSGKQLAEQLLSSLRDFKKKELINESPLGYVGEVYYKFLPSLCRELEWRYSPYLVLLLPKTVNIGKYVVITPSILLIRPSSELEEEAILTSLLNVLTWLA